MRNQSTLAKTLFSFVTFLEFVIGWNVRQSLLLLIIIPTPLVMRKCSTMFLCHVLFQLSDLSIQTI